MSCYICIESISKITDDAIVSGKPTLRSSTSSAIVGRIPSESEADALFRLLVNENHSVVSEKVREVTEQKVPIKRLLRHWLQLSEIKDKSQPIVRLDRTLGNAVVRHQDVDDVKRAMSNFGLER